MINIYERVSKVFDSIENKSKEYIKGFQDCLYLFRIGISKDVKFKYDYRIHQLERLNKENDKQIKKLLAELNTIKEKSSVKTLLDVQPLNVFHLYIVNTEVGSFDIVVNMDKNSFDICLTAFRITHTFDNLEQAKLRLLQFINLKNGQGYKAYKNSKEAIKEGIKIV